jgi:ATP-dependent Clp protease ATP-binding subunit ClpA
MKHVGPGINRHSLPESQEAGMHQRFTDRAHKVMQLANEEAAQTPRAKKVIEYAILEARELNHNYVGTEHLLLGLIREDENVAAQVLMNLGVNLSSLRQDVMQMLGVTSGQTSRPQQPSLRLLSRAAAMLDSLTELFQEMKYDAVAEGQYQWAAVLAEERDKLIEVKKRLSAPGGESSEHKG